jgi:F-type H+-transporting ATPase subunit b
MFEFTSSLFFWTSINFIVLLFLLHKLILPAFYKMVEEHHQKKEADAAEIEKNRDLSRKVLAEYESKLSAVKEEAESILAQAREERELLKKQALESLIQEKNELLKGIKAELQHERKQFVDEMNAHAADLITSVARKLIKKELTQADHEAIIRQNIEDFEALIKS